MEPSSYDYGFGEETQPDRGNRKWIVGLVMGLILGIVIGGIAAGFIGQRLELNLESPVAMMIVSNLIFVILITLIIAAKARRVATMEGKPAPQRAIILSVVLGLTVLLGLGMIFFTLSR